MRAVFSLGILLTGALAGPLTAQRERALREGILRAEDHRPRTGAELETLWRGLASQDTLTLKLAIRALGRLERPAVSARLFPLLGHRVPGVRAQAAEAVAQAAQGYRGDSSSALRGASWTAILAALGARVTAEQDLRVRGMLALSLGRLPYGNRGEIERAREWLLTLSSGTAGVGSIDIVRGMATMVRLTGRRVPLSGEFLLRLRQLLGEGADARVRRLALAALLAVQPLDVGWVSLAQQSPDPELRRIGAAGISRLIAGDERERLAREALHDSAARVRYEALGAWARSAGRASCPALGQATRDSAASVGLLALDLLGTICAGDSTASRLLAGATRESAGTWHRAAHGLLGLARVDPAAAAPALSAALRSPIWQTRMYAAKAAGAMRDSTGLRRLARDSVANVREAALAGLHEFTGHRDDALYRAALEGSEGGGAPDYQVALTATRALAGTPEPAAAAAALLNGLDRMTRDRSETSRDPRVAMLVRLRELGGPSLSARVSPYLRDFDPVVADSAAALLNVWSGHPQRAAPDRLPETVFSLREIEGLRRRRLRFTMAGGGSFEVALLVEEAPVTVLRVVRLAMSGYYQGLGFHRVVPNFVIQGGSPGANEYAGHSRYLRDELGPLSHERGTLGISTRGRDTGDAQLFVNLIDNPRLDYDYTVWGRVVSGMEVVDAILEGDLIRQVELIPSAPVRQSGSVADTAFLMGEVRALAADSMEGRRAGTSGGARARRYLTARLRALGLAPLGSGFEQQFAIPGGATGVNLLAVIPGTKPSVRYVVLSAHYDHLGIVGGQIYNGADDNASGTAAVLAIARELRRTPLEHPVILALFDAEEEGLLGAKAFVAQSRVPKAAIGLDVNLDMVGHSERGELWAAGGAHYPALLPTLEAVAARAAVKLRLGHDRPGVSGEQDWTLDSDHGVFHSAGIPFVYFGVEDHQDYHRPSDDPETLTPGFFGNAVATILEALRRLDRVIP